MEVKVREKRRSGLVDVVRDMNRFFNLMLLQAVPSTHFLQFDFYKIVSVKTETVFSYTEGLMSPTRTEILY